jgi:glycosyltransferase involved in cell wall biosynthesis
MRVLFVSNSFPNNLSTSTNPSIGGTQRRLDMLIEALRHIAQLDVLFYVPPTIDISPAAIAQTEQELSKAWNTKINLFLCHRFSLPVWKQWWEGIFDFSRQRAFLNASGIQQLQAFEACLKRQPDAIFLHRLQSTYPALATQHPLPPVFFDLDDIEHIKLLRVLQQPPIQLKASLYYLQVPALWKGERRVIQLARRTFVCSELDRQYLTKRWGLPGVVSIPNALPIPLAQAISAEPTLLLLGSYNYPPNVEAANFLIEHVLPLIHQKLPQAKLIVAGINPHKIRSYDTEVANVEFTGFVDDLNALYQRSRVVCCPIFSGGGTRIKMIEAAAYNKPIVATQVGAEGLEMVPNQDFLLCNTAQEFANGCLELLKNDQLCDRLAASARAAAIQNYDLNSIVKLIQSHVESAIGIHSNMTVTSASSDEHR